jgi:hypothetical protein
MFTYRHQIVTFNPFDDAARAVGDDGDDGDDPSGASNRARRHQIESHHV